MRKIVAIVMATVLTLSIAGCGGATDEPETASLQDAVEVMAEEPTPVTVDATTQESTEEEPVVLGENLLKNGDFHNDLVGWDTYLAKGGNGVLSNRGETGHVKIMNSGKVNYAVQVFYDGFELKQGGKYEFAFDMSSSINRNIECRIQVNGGDYHPYVDNYMDVSGEMRHYSFEFEMTETDPAPRLCFNLGTPDGISEPLEEHEFDIDNVSVVLVDDSMISKEVVDVEVKDIITNQVGFLPDAKKTVVVRNSGGINTFDVVDESGKSVFSGQLSAENYAKAAGENVSQGDFSELTKDGIYRIKVGDNMSFPFAIGDDCYDELLKSSFLFLYSQRCGVPLEASLAGSFAHEACHTGDALIYGTDKKKQVTGGWHDAGDYGRYVAPGAVTVADLFLTYEDCASIWNFVYGDNTGIPESGNGVPDILDEARFELEWILQMQSEEGNFYHKISGYEFPGFVMPQEETAQMVLAPVSSTATGDAAAVLAKAYVLYKPYDKEFADKCLASAKKAWKALEKMPAGEGYHNPDDILTGEYPDMRDPDERYWAAIELYNATGDKEYATYAENVINQYVAHGFGWAQVNSYGNIAYLSLDTKLQNADCVNKIKNSILEDASKIYQNVEEDGYYSILGDNYCWGSNMLVSNNARQLLLAYSINGDEKYKEAAFAQISYLLGENATSYSFVTGYGSLTPVSVHHRPSIATGSVIPGMVVGGPNCNLEDPYAKATLGGTPMAKCYVDNNQSYSINEVTIYWNSPFIYLLSRYMEEYAPITK